MANISSETSQRENEMKWKFVLLGFLIQSKAVQFLQYLEAMRKFFTPVFYHLNMQSASDISWGDREDKSEFAERWNPAPSQVANPGVLWRSLCLRKEFNTVFLWSPQSKSEVRHWAICVWYQGQRLSESNTHVDKELYPPAGVWKRRPGVWRH